jgi:S-adenosylmethionine-diacylglycerol 3-amino-3-carboxypropyl transferase
MLGRFIGLAHLLAKLARIDLSALLRGKAGAPERLQALDRLHRLFHSPLARLITGTPALLFSLGIPPQQRALLGGGAPLNEVLHERLLRLINGHPNETIILRGRRCIAAIPVPGITVSRHIYSAVSSNACAIVRD